MPIVNGEPVTKTGVLYVKDGGTVFVDATGAKFPISNLDVAIPQGSELPVSARIIPSSSGGYNILRLTPTQIVARFVAVPVEEVLGPWENKKFGGSYCVIWCKVIGMLDPFGNETGALRNAVFPKYLNLTGRTQEGKHEALLKVHDNNVVMLTGALQQFVKDVFPEAFTGDCNFIPDMQQDPLETAVDLLRYLISTFPKKLEITVADGKVKDVKVKPDTGFAKSG